MSSSQTLLVTGAGGHLGRRVVELLLEGGARRVIAASRRPEKLADLAARGAETRRADFDDPDSLAEAFKGVNGLLIVSTDAVEQVGARRRQHRAAIAAAEKAGVKHVVYTSGPAPTPGKPVLDDHYWSEHALAASGLSWTVLRNNLYTDLLLQSLPRAIATGRLVTAAGAGGRSYVTREDCARTAAAALNSNWSGRRILDVTGPEALTQDGIAALASEISGKSVTHVPVSAADFRAGALGAGLPASLVEALATFDIDAAQGFHGAVTPVVADLTGRGPDSVRDFLRANSAALLGAHAA